ncbi:hypothetical protein U1Q18_007412 [Sarracenia purpurea var. burkii]
MFSVALVLAAGDFWISGCIQWYHLLLMAISVADSAMSWLNMLLSAAGSFSELWLLVSLCCVDFGLPWRSCLYTLAELPLDSSFAALLKVFFFKSLDVHDWFIFSGDGAKVAIDDDVVKFSIFPWFIALGCWKPQ